MYEYYYPDTDDILTIKFISELEKNEPYWAESENRILNRISGHIHRLSISGGSFLDAGCGKGRLLPVFGHIFQRGVAVEPDPFRYQKTIELLDKNGLGNKIRVINTSAEKYNSFEQFDFILCSHVIQHIHTDAVIPLLQNLYNHLSHNGILALTTCHSTSGQDYYGKNYLKDDMPVREIVSREVFNSLIEEKGILPIHFFDTDSFVCCLEETGFTLADFSVFHVAREERTGMQGKDIDNWVNSSPDMQKQHGVDMYLLLQKRNN